MKYGYGVDLGGTTVKIAYFDENGTMLEKWEIPTVTADGGKAIHRHRCTRPCGRQGRCKPLREPGLGRV